jgi:cysteine desulfurase/selenocysteine lyase
VERKIIYLNNSATSFPKPPGVAEAVALALSLEPPGHGRGPAERPGDVVTPDMVRQRLAELLNASSHKDIALTFNASDGLNLAIRGILEPGDHAICTALDHNSVLRPLAHLRRDCDINFTVAHASKNAEIYPDDIAMLINPRTKLIVVNHISNVTGFITDIAAIAELAGEHGIILLVDAAQSGGHLPIDVSSLGVAMLAITGHKGLLGPAGTGALWVHPDINLKPFRAGGTGAFSEAEFQPEERPYIFEAGTPNLHGFAGLYASIEFLMEQDIDKIHEHEIGLCRIAWDALNAINGVRTYGPGFEGQRGAVVIFNIKDIPPTEAAIILYNEFGIVVRPGLHCAPYAHKALGTYPDGAVRLSPGVFNTEDNIGALCAAIKEIAEKGN